MPTKIEILGNQGVYHPDINKENLDEDTLGRLTGWIHSIFCMDDKLNDDLINDVTVDIGQNKD
jgi:hypothetical protein